MTDRDEILKTLAQMEQNLSEINSAKELIGLATSHSRDFINHIDNYIAQLNKVLPKLAETIDAVGEYQDNNTTLLNEKTTTIIERVKEGVDEVGHHQELIAQSLNEKVEVLLGNIERTKDFLSKTSKGLVGSLKDTNEEIRTVNQKLLEELKSRVNESLRDIEERFHSIIASMEKKQDAHSFAIQTQINKNRKHTAIFASAIIVLIIGIGVLLFIKSA